jgi:hypothetical protein
MSPDIVRQRSRLLVHLGEFSPIIAADVAFIVSRVDQFSVVGVA